MQRHARSVTREGSGVHLVSVHEALTEELLAAVGNGDQLAEKGC